MGNFSPECAGTRNLTATRRGKKGVDHKNCMYTTCICNCHKSKDAGLLHMEQREDFLYDYTVMCFDCEEDAEFVHNGFQKHVADFLMEHGWVNLNGSMKTNKGKWVCWECAMERMPDLVH